MGDDGAKDGADERQRTAERAVAALWRGDAASRQLGMQVESCGAGRATVTMRIREDMVNGHRICHGGLVFALADSAFAFACNSYGNNTVAAGAARAQEGRPRTRPTSLATSFIRRVSGATAVSGPCAASFSTARR